MTIFKSPKTAFYFIIILLFVNGCKKQALIQPITFQVTTNKTQVSCYTIAAGSNTSGLGYFFDVYEAGSSTRIIRSADYNVSTNHTYTIDACTGCNYTSFFSTDKEYSYQISMWCRCIDSISQQNVCSGMGYEQLQLLKEGTFIPSRNSSANIIAVNLN